VHSGSSICGPGRRCREAVSYVRIGSVNDVRLVLEADVQGTALGVCEA
jgi:hypothetical protein